MDIKRRIAERFQPTLDIIQRQTACEHKWPEKHGAAYYRCSICGYLADDRELDRFISIQKMIYSSLDQSADPNRLANSAAFSSGTLYCSINISKSFIIDLGKEE